MNIRRKIAFVALLMLTGMAQAQNAVAIHQKNGQVATFAFTEKPVVTYSGSDLVLTTTKTTVNYPIYLLKKLVFDVDWTESVNKIENVQTSDVLFRFHDGTLSIIGGQPGSIVTLHNIKGQKVGQYRLDADGSATIPTQPLGKDIYIVKTKSLSFKFSKP